MLLRFEAANHRSIDGPVELSMIAVDKGRPATRSFELLDEEVLTVAGIYGPNASGKSNVLDALAWLAEAVHGSFRQWDEVIPRDPFRFGGRPAEPSTYEADLMVDGVRYTYRLEVDDERVTFEGLYSYPLRKQRVLFERDGDDLHFRRGLAGAIGTTELLTRTTTALSAAMRTRESELRSFGRALAGIRSLGSGRLQRQRPISHRGMSASTSMIFDHAKNSRRFMADGATVYESPSDLRGEGLAMLRFADLGIDDVVIEESADKEVAGANRRTVQFVHKVAGQQVRLPLAEESDGTRTWFRLIGPVLTALRQGQVTLVDEIDASLHPRLSARLLELFQDPETNPRGAQLIFTSHDTSLLNHLNRDEVWLTEKGADGATGLTALAEYGGERVRKSVNLEKAYLQGRFGAVPELDQYVIRRALGLTTDT